MTERWPDDGTHLEEGVEDHGGSRNPDTDGFGVVDVDGQLDPVSLSHLLFDQIPADLSRRTKEVSTYRWQC